MVQILGIMVLCRHKEVGISSLLGMVGLTKARLRDIRWKIECEEEGRRSI